METAEERKFARMSLLDHDETDDKASGGLPSRTSSTKTRVTATVDEVPRGPRGRVYSNKYRQEAFGPEDGSTMLRGGSPRHSRAVSASEGWRASSEIPTSEAIGPLTDTATGTTYDGNMVRRRGSSLSSRFAGDQSHRPLDIIRRESLRAQRAPHLRRPAHHGADSIDQLAGVDGIAWHHEGPYDAASLARNRRWRNSPLEALQATNREALKAVPREKVHDSIEHHRPLDGFAYMPPGMRDPHGRIFHYEEGDDMMRFNGADYRRWPGIDYHPDDLKGKGEPSFSIERALKGHSRDHRRVMSEGGIEMINRPSRTRSLHASGSGREPPYTDRKGDLQRHGSAGHAEEQRRRNGTLRQRRPPPAETKADSQEEE